jgi:hypothetical protein
MIRRSFRLEKSEETEGFTNLVKGMKQGFSTLQT